MRVGLRRCLGGARLEIDELGDPAAEIGRNGSVAGKIVHLH